MIPANQLLFKHFNAQVAIGAGEFNEVANLFHLEKFKKGSFVIQAGNFVQHQYFVVKGCLSTFMIDSNGKEHTIHFAVENWWVSDYISYYKEGSSILNVECIEDCHLLKVHKNQLLSVFDKNPVVERFFRLQLENAFVAYQRRILSNLQQTAEQRYSDFVQTYSDIEHRVKNYQIASYLGITPESLSRLRKQRMANN